MKFFPLLLLLAQTNCAIATTTDPAKIPLPDTDMCALLDAELRHAVKIGTLNEQEAAIISLNCWTSP